MAETRVVGGALRTPRAAAVAGIAFSVIFAVALVLVRIAVPADPSDAGRWLSDGSRRDAAVATGLVVSGYAVETAALATVFLYRLSRA